MTEEESPIFLEQVTPAGEQFIAGGIAYAITVKVKSMPLKIPSVESEQDDS